MPSLYETLTMALGPVLQSLSADNGNEGGMLDTPYILEFHGTLGELMEFAKSLPGSAKFDFRLVPGANQDTFEKDDETYVRLVDEALGSDSGESRQ